MPPMFRHIFLDHPAAVNESFGAHFRVAMGFSLSLFAAAGAALVHAFLPCVFEKTASRLVGQIHARLEHR